MDIKEIKETIQGLENDLSNIKIVSKNTIIDLINNSNEYDKKAVIDCFCSMLGSIIKITSYDLKSVLSSLDSLPTDNTKITIVTDGETPSLNSTVKEVGVEPVKETTEIENTNTEEPEKELTYKKKKEIFKKRLRKLRARNNISMTELASLMNKPYNLIYSWEVKGCIPKQPALEELAKLFNVPSQYLVGEGE